jgi:RNase P subunit RPR2
MSDLYLNQASILHCDKCRERLGVLHTLRYALFKKPGMVYYVICKACHHQNQRIKGEYKQKTEEAWKHFQPRE